MQKMKLDQHISIWTRFDKSDEYPIDRKAKLPGDYVKKIGIKMDIRCFFGISISVLRRNGVVEGGTSSLANKGYLEANKSHLVRLLGK